MSKENYLNKIKELPEVIKQFGGLVVIVIIIFFSFSVLNIMFGGGDELVRKMKLEEERIAKEKKLSELISKLPSGILVTFDGTGHHKLTEDVYEQVCKATKLIPQRAIMGANFLNFRAHELYTMNGNKIRKTRLSIYKRIIEIFFKLINYIKCKSCKYRRGFIQIN